MKIAFRISHILLLLHSPEEGLQVSGTVSACYNTKYHNTESSTAIQVGKFLTDLNFFKKTTPGSGFPRNPMT